MGNLVTPRTQLASNVAPKPMSRVCGLEPTTENGVRCLELKVFQYRPVRVLCTDAASIKVLASVGISFSNRFCLDGVELPDRVIRDVEWLIRYHRDSEGHLHIDNVEKNDMAVKQHPVPPKKAEPGALVNAKENAKASNLAAELKRVNEAMRTEQNRRGMGHLDGVIFWNNKLAEKFGIGTETVNIREAIIGLPNYSFDSIMAAWVAILEADPGYIPPKPTPETPTSELPKAFPRCAIHNLPLEDGKCPTCVLNESMSPDVEKPEHWSKDDKERTLFFGHMKEDFSHFRESAMMKAEERLAFIHEALGNIEHLHQSPLSRDNAEATVRDLLSKRYSTAAKVGWTNDKELDMPTEKQPEPHADKPAETSTTSQPEQAPIVSTPVAGIPTAAPQNQTVPCPEKVANSNGAEKAITIAPVPTPEIAIFDPNRAIALAKASSDLVRTLRTSGVLVAGHDFGKIPGTGDKDVLLKPGAEKLCKAFNLCPMFEDVDKVEKWDVAAPLFHYRIRCSLVDIATGAIIATGIGSCNSMESKYRWRDEKRKCPKCGKEIRHSKNQGEGWYCWRNTGGCGATFKENDPEIKNQVVGKVPNDDVFSLINTIDKMAQKRALIAATLIGTNASDYFTQDIDTLPDFGYIDAEIIEAA